jgi:hypothetical protein
MPASSLIPKQTVGRTFFTAIVILGLVALVQLGGLGWAFLTRIHAVAQTESSFAFRGSETPVEETKELKMTDSFAPPESTQVASLPKPTPIVQGPAAKQISPTAGRQNELAEQAKALRERGDMSTALTRLREAQALAANNPYIISEMAITYEKMNIKDKALEQWRRIYDMGESAGIYYTTADAKLKSVDAQTPGADGTLKKDSEGFQPGSVLALVDIVKADSANPDKKFTLKIPLKARPDTRIETHEVAIQVFFYDSVEDGSVVQTNANVTSRWSTLPVDWNNNDIEILEVEYSALIPKSKTPPETRKFYGYIVRVYYKGELQDMRAEPVKLLKQYPPPLTLSSEEMK